MGVLERACEEVAECIDRVYATCARICWQGVLIGCVDRV